MDSLSDQANSQIYTVKLDQVLIPLSQGNAVGQREEIVVDLVINNKYQVLELIGKGGMGAVYRARHLQLGKDVALKTFRTGELQMQIDGSAWMRFQREAQAIARLDHPNVVKVFDFGVAENGLPFYTMELLQGCSLADSIANQEVFELDDALQIFIEVCSGLAAAHAKGIIHRDVKPANIFLAKLSSSGDKPTAKLVDFGIASWVSEHADARVTAVGEIFGSPLFMSPEQFRGKNVGVASDIYSCGCAFFELLTGRPPYRGDTASATMIMHLNEAVPRLTETLPGCYIPQRLDFLLASMLGKIPQERPASMKAVLDELTAVRLLLERKRGSVSEAGTGDPASDSVFAVERNRMVLLWAIVALWLVATGALAFYFLTPHHRAPLEKINSGGVGTDSVSDAVIPKQVEGDFESRIAERLKYSEELPQEDAPPALKSLVRGSFDRTTGRERLAHKRHFVFPAGVNLGKFVCKTSFAGDGVARGEVVVPEEACFEGNEIVFRWPQALEGFKADSISRFYMDSKFKVRDRHLRYISELNSLVSLSAKGASLTSASIPHLNKLTHLRELAVPNCDLTGDDFAHLQRLRELSSLDASDTVGADRLLAALSGSKSIVVLRLNNCKLTDADLLPISKLTSLIVLSIDDNTQITDAGLAQLAGFGQLNALDAQNCQLTARCIKTLAHFTKLKFLRLDTYGWTIDQTSALRAALPPGAVHSDMKAR